MHDFHPKIEINEVQADVLRREGASGATEFDANGDVAGSCSLNVIQPAARRARSMTGVSRHSPNHTGRLSTTGSPPPAGLNSTTGLSTSPTETSRTLTISTSFAGSAYPNVSLCRVSYAVRSGVQSASTGSQRIGSVKDCPT